MLGLRHGLDWDHIAAINDIAGGDVLAARSASIPRFAFSALAYGCGHVTSVLMLVLLVRTVIRTLPPWLDPIMERLVGSSLIVLGIWLFVSIVLDVRSKRTPSAVSRWSLVGGAIAKWTKLPCLSVNGLPTVGLPAAFCIGALHGIGAETGTQVALLGSVSGTHWSAVVSILASFCAGLLVCSWLVGMMFTLGLSSLMRVRYAAAFFGALTAFFSIVVGCSLILNQATDTQTSTSLGQPR